MATADNTTNLSVQPAPAIDRERHTPSTGRRRLFGLAAGAAAAITAPAVIAATPAIATPAIQENPELLEIGRQLPALLENYRAAVARRSEAAAVCERTRPTLPEELIWSPEHHRGGGLHRSETGLDGAEVYLGEMSDDGSRYNRSTYRWKLVQSEIILREISRHTKEGKQLHRIARLAKKYERDTGAALKASGYWEREGEVGSASVKIDKLAWKLHQHSDLKPCTAKGVLVYANVMLAVDECAGRDDIRGRGHIAYLALIVADALSRIEGVDVGTAQ